MDTEKIKRFEFDNPGLSFPWFRHLNTQEADALRESVIRKLSVGGETTGLALVNRLLDMSVPVEGFNAEAGEFSLLPVIEELVLTPTEHIYVNWYRFDDIDCVAFRDLAEFFDYYWYPAVDDIDVFDATLSWILSITHFGQIRIFKLNAD